MTLKRTRSSSLHSDAYYDSKQKRVGKAPKLDCQQLIAEPSVPSSHSTSAPTLAASDPSPLSASTSPSPISLERFPLTQENLTAHSSRMGPKTAAGTGTGTATTASSSGASMAQVRTCLRRNNILINDPSAEERGSGIMEKARKIIGGSRRSVMTMETAEKLRRLAREHEADTEFTYLVNVWGVLLNDERWARVTDDTIDDDDAKEWLEHRAWVKDFLKCQYNADFEKGSIPPLALDPHQEDLLKSLGVDVGRVANPKPDLTFGFKPEAFTDNEQRINDSQKARLCLNLDHAFFVVEVKSGGAPIGDAENQAARAGCAMNSLKRNFNRAATGARDNQEEATGLESKDQNQAVASSAATEDSQAISTSRPETAVLKPAGYAVDDAFTFTMALDPNLAKIFVNWSEEKYSGKSNRPSVFYQMNQIETYNLSKAAEWRDLHSAIDNILDWGVGRNKRTLQGLCAQIAAAEAATTRKKRRRSERIDG